MVLFQLPEVLAESLIVCLFCALLYLCCCIIELGYGHFQWLYSLSNHLKCGLWCEIRKSPLHFLVHSLYPVDIFYVYIQLIICKYTDSSLV